MAVIAVPFVGAKLRALGAVALAAAACVRNPIQPEPTLEFPAVGRRIPVLDAFLQNLELTEVIATNGLRAPDARELVNVQIDAMTDHVRRKVGSAPTGRSPTSGHRTERERLARSALELLPYLDIDSGELQLARVAAHALATKLGDDAEYVPHPANQTPSFEFSAELRDGIAVLRLRHLSADMAARAFGALNQWAGTVPAPRAILLDLSRCELARPQTTTALFDIFAPGQTAFRLEYRDPNSGRLEQSVWKNPADWESPVVSRAPLFVWISRSAPAVVEAALVALREHRELVVLGDKTTGSGRYPAWLNVAGGGWFGFTTADVLDAWGRPMRGRPVYPDACAVDGRLVDGVEHTAQGFEQRCGGGEHRLELEDALRYVAAATSSGAPVSAGAP